MTARFTNHVEPSIEEKIVLKNEWIAMKALLEKVVAGETSITEIQKVLSDLQYKPIDWEKLKV